MRPGLARDAPTAASQRSISILRLRASKPPCEIVLLYPQDERFSSRACQVLASQLGLPQLQPVMGASRGDRNGRSGNHAACVLNRKTSRLTGGIGGRVAIAVTPQRQEAPTASPSEVLSRNRGSRRLRRGDEASSLARRATAVRAKRARERD